MAHDRQNIKKKKQKIVQKLNICCCELQIYIFKLFFFFLFFILFLFTRMQIQRELETPFGNMVTGDTHTHMRSNFLHLFCVYKNKRKIYNKCVFYGDNGSG